MCRKHGDSHYRNCGCRCDTCRKANTARARREIEQRRAHTAANNGVAVNARAHGTATYNNWRCRCDVCVTAWRENERRLYYKRLGREVPADA